MLIRPDSYPHRIRVPAILAFTAAVTAVAAGSMAAAAWLFAHAEPPPTAVAVTLAPTPPVLLVLFLSLALWAGLSNVMDSGWAGVIVAVVWAVIGAIAFVVGRNNARRTHPTPERTVDTLKQVPDALKGR